jgi:hypothetical protein
MQLNIPDEYENEFIAIGENLSDNIWRLARLTNILIQVYVSDGSYTNAQVYNYVEKRVGKPSGTIRDYAEVARDFDQEIQDRYSNLKFDHFRRAKRLSKKYNVDPEKMLKWAFEHSDSLGIPATVSSMTANFANVERGLQERLMIMLETLLQELIDNGADMASIETVKDMMADIISTIKEPIITPRKYWNHKQLEKEII